MVDLDAANHTNRELQLMLEGRKPLAFFCDEISFLPNEEIIPEASFAPYVESGQFVRSQVTYEESFVPKLGRNARILYVFFAAKAEAWRIPAFLLTQDVARRMGHSEAIERIQSALLGYTQEEVDAWCQRQFGDTAV